MAVKYTRDSRPEHAHGEHGRFHRPLRKSPGELQSRLRLIYYGIFAFTCVMFLAYAMGYLKPRQWGEIQTGLGTITEKSTLIAEDNTTIHAITLSLTEPPLSETVSIDEQTWRALTVEDQVPITYRLSLDNTQLRVEQLEPTIVD